MQLNREACYRALSSRDTRFDGKFFIGVKTTGVYCRPVCPAPRALKKNCVFFSCAAAAEDAGFRPCLRCFPERSPNHMTVANGEEALGRALRLIDAGALDEEGVEALSQRLTISSRHLRRLFSDQLGTSPLAIARTRRVQIAKRLLDETALSITQIAFASGFQTIRQFNGTFRKLYGRSPSDLRRPQPIRNGKKHPNTHFELKLPFHLPFDWTAMLDYLRPRLLDGIEQISGGTFRRRAVYDAEHGVVEVSHQVDHLRLKIPVALWPHLQDIVVRARCAFDVDADPQLIAEHLAGDPALSDRLIRQPDLRVPGCWDPFELSIRAILGQQISVAGATTLCGRLIRTWGERLGDGEEPAWAFPSAARLARVKVDKIGIPATRANTIREFAKVVNRGQVSFDGSQSLDGFLSNVMALPGIGPWTANYIAMRALREPDAFPAGDLGVRKALSGATGRLPTEKQVLQRAEAWRPWRSYAAMLLWKT